MSYITRAGESALQDEQKVDASKALAKFKSGTTYKVRIGSAADTAEYYCHSVYKVFNSTPCTKASGQPDLYDRAVDLLYADAKEAEAAGNEKLAEELRNKAYLLKAKPRYLFGFFNLDDGKEIVIDLSKKQRDAIRATIEKFAKKLDKVAFELSKQGDGQSTSVSLTPVLDMDEELTEQQRKNFAETAGKQFNADLFGKVFAVKSPAEQAEDLRAFGFDVSRLGIGEGRAETEISEEDLPF